MHYEEEAIVGSVFNSIQRLYTTLSGFGHSTYMTISFLPVKCNWCSVNITVENALDCKKEGIVIQQHANTAIVT